MRENYFGMKNWHYAILICVLAVIAYHIGVALR